MPDPTTKPRAPRRRRTRPTGPPHQVVALAALSLEPDSPIAWFLRSLPSVGDRMVQIEALRHVEQLAPDLGMSLAEAVSATSGSDHFGRSLSDSRQVLDAETATGTRPYRPAWWARFDSPGPPPLHA